MMSLWDALRMNMMISYQELVRTFLRAKSEFAASDNVKYHLMETLRRMTIFVIGTLGVLILVLMEGDY